MSVKPLFWPRTYLENERQNGSRDGGDIWVTLDNWKVLAFRCGRFFGFSSKPHPFLTLYILLLVDMFHSYDSNYHLYAIEFQICSCSLNLSPEFQTHISSHAHFHLEVIKALLTEKRWTLNSHTCSLFLFFSPAKL